MVCPECNGEGRRKTIVFPVFAPSVTAKQKQAFYDRMIRDGIKCTACDGSGEVRPEYPLWKARGKQMLEVRKDLSITIRKAAETLGLSLTEYSALEHARVPISEQRAQAIIAALEGA